MSFFVHILTLLTQVQLGPHDIIAPGSYVVEDINGAQLLLLASGGKMESFMPGDKIEPRYDYSNKKILLVRVGGFGDLILLTPVMRAIKARWPSCELHVCTMAHYGQVLQGLPFVDKVVPYPLAYDSVMEYASVVYYENAIEHNRLAEKVHMTELFASLAGMPVPEVMQPAYAVRASEAVWAAEMFPRVNGTRRVCIQVGASGICRVFPRHALGEVVGMMLRHGWEVFLLGAKGEIKLPDGSPKNLRNLSEMDLTFRQSAAVVNGADVFIGSDSALLHIAGALNVPAVGLYGPFPWKLRTAHCPNTVALQGSGACSPCFHHASASLRNHFPDKCPSKDKGYCEVLASIDPKRIVAKAESIARTLDDRKQAEVVEL